MTCRGCDEGYCDLDDDDLCPVCAKIKREDMSDEPVTEGVGYARLS